MEMISLSFLKEHGTRMCHFNFARLPANKISSVRRWCHDHAQHSLGSSVVLSIIAAGQIMLASCATLSEEQRVERNYDRANKLILARENFQQRAAHCEQQGGVMEIKRYGSSRVGKITAHEYNSARCVSY